jgi:histidinol-phosphate/aromatic aminotransferase/cobyric acid decarboxylase-like protein
LHGFSKAFAMTGWRIGYACGPAVLIEAMMKVHQYSMMCASIISQEGAIEALLRGEDGMKAMRDQYHRRRDFIVRRFNEIGLKCHLPRGSFYAFPSVAVTKLGEKEFALGLLKPSAWRSCPARRSAPTAPALCARASPRATSSSSRRPTASSGTCRACARKTKRGEVVKIRALSFPV